MINSSLARLAATIPLILLLCISYAGFPGVPNYDIFHIYVQAANHSGNTWWSLPLEQLWSLCMYLGLVHIGWFYCITALLLGLGSLVILTQLQGSVLQKTIFGILFFACPYFSFFLYRVYRINLSIGALLLAIGFALLFLNTHTKYCKYIYCALSVCLMLLAAIARIDMFFACLPIFCFFIQGKSFKKGALIFFFVSSLYLVGVKSMYWLSKALYNQTNEALNSGFVPSMNLDLIGISHLSGKNQYPADTQIACANALQSALTAYRESYAFPNLTWRKSKKPCRISYAKLRAAWIQSIVKHPILYIRHRIHWSLVLLGLEQRAELYKIDAWGLDLTSGLVHEELSTMTSVRSLAATALYPISIEPFYASNSIIEFERWVRTNQQRFYFKGYFYCLLHLLALVLLLLRRRLSLPVLLISSSGVLHFIAISIFSPSFHYRYIGWFVFSGWIAFWLALIIVPFRRNSTPTPEQQTTLA